MVHAYKCREMHRKKSFYACLCQLSYSTFESGYKDLIQNVIMDVTN